MSGEPMRVFWVWMKALAAIFMLSLGWYIMCVVCTNFASNALSDVTGQAFNMVSLLEFVVAWWGPIMDGLIIVLAILNSQEFDPWGRLSG